VAAAVVPAAAASAATCRQQHRADPEVVGAYCQSCTSLRVPCGACWTARACLAFKTLFRGLLACRHGG
jgi:hypothetical protein